MTLYNIIPTNPEERTLLKDDQPMPDVAPVADSTKFCADWRQAYDEKCQAANVTCKAVPDDYCPVAN